MAWHEATVLTSRPHREVDRLITLFGPSLGRCEVLARGARKPTSKLAASLEPFTGVRIELVPGRTWPTVIHVDVRAARRRLRLQLGGLAQAGFVVALAEALVRAEDRNLRLFTLVERELQRIDRSAGERLVPADALALALLTLRALSVAGWRPDFDRCTVCRRPLGAAAAAFHGHPFGVAHVACRRGGVRVSSATRRYLTVRLSRPTRTPVVVGRIVAREVGAIASSALTAVLERPLAATRFLRAVMHQRGGDSHRRLVS